MVFSIRHLDGILHFAHKVLPHTQIITSHDELHNHQAWDEYKRQMVYTAQRGVQAMGVKPSCTAQPAGAIHGGWPH